MGTVKMPAGLVVSKNTGGLGTTAQAFRRALAGMFKQSSPGTPIPGRLALNHCVVAGTGSMNYTVSAGGLLLVRSASQGVHLVGLHQSVTVSTDPTSGVNPRIDRIYAFQPDPGLDGTGTDPDWYISVAVGTPAATPTVPAIPAGALELGRKLLAKNATNTNTGAAFTNPAPVTGVHVDASLISLSQGGLQNVINSLVAQQSALMSEVNALNAAQAAWTASSGIVTAASLHQITSQVIVGQGRWVQARFIVKRTGANRDPVPGGTGGGNVTNYMIGTIAAPYRPLIHSGLNVIGVGPVVAAHVRAGDGVIHVAAGIPGWVWEKNEELELEGSWLRVNT